MKLDLKEWISKVAGQFVRVTVIAPTLTAPSGAAATNVNLSNYPAIPSGATVLCATPIASQSPAWVSISGAYNSLTNTVEVGTYNHYSSALTGIVTILVLYVGGYSVAFLRLSAISLKGVA